MLSPQPIIYWQRLLDNHIHQGNALGIDTRQILWKRCLDIERPRLKKRGAWVWVAKADGFVQRSTTLS